MRCRRMLGCAQASLPPDTSRHYCPARADTTLPLPLFLRGRSKNVPVPMPLPVHFFSSPCPHESISSISPKPVESRGRGRGKNRKHKFFSFTQNQMPPLRAPALGRDRNTLVPEAKAFLEANQKADGYPRTWWGTPSALIWLQECFKTGAVFASPITALRQPG